MPADGGSSSTLFKVRVTICTRYRMSPLRTRQPLSGPLGIICDLQLAERRPKGQRVLRDTELSSAVEMSLN